MGGRFFSALGGLKILSVIEEMEVEEWRDVTGSNYMVSDQGRVKHKIKDTFCIPYLCNGYPRIRIHYNDGRQKDERIHRLVASYFIENPDEKPYVNHKDGNQLNNCATNLEWVTAQENMRHYHATEVRPHRVRLIFTREGREPMVFASIQEAATHFNKAPATLWGYSKNGHAWGWTITREEY